MTKLTKAQQRDIAMGAVRSHLRMVGIDPRKASINQTESALNELMLYNPKLIAAQWYANSSKRQWLLWKTEWRKWQRGQSI